MNSPNNQVARMGIEGRYQITKWSPSRGTKEVFESFPNLITDIGMDRPPAGSCIGFCYVGTGTGTPSFSDVSMFNFLVSSSTVPSGSVVQTNGPAPDYWCRYQVTYRFAEGVAAGNLSEVGIGWNSNPSGAIFSHALILDGMGNPTTITVLSDEVLDVTYIFTLYPNVTDVTGTIDISGVNYDYVSRPSNIGSWPAAALLLGFGNSISSNQVMWSGGLGPITGAPSGSNAGGQTSITRPSGYTPGTYALRVRYTYTLTLGNVTGGAKSHVAQLGNISSSVFRIQTEYTPAIPKDATKVLTLDYTFSWTRR